ncbi:MAG: aryl-sulfate sulfotransferase [Gammaproteobacteria bacterium]
MKRTLNQLALVAATICFASTATHAFPSVYPTGATIYDPEKAWNGYTIHPTPEGKGAVLVDMNGNLVRRFEDIPGSPIRILPGGHVMGRSGEAVVQYDWDGNEVWRFDRTEQIEDDEGNLVWSSRQHHDWQREGLPAGYFSPAQTPMIDRGRTLILAVKNLTVPEIMPRRLRDDYVLEVSWDGEILWDWLPSDHVDELGFSEEERYAIYHHASWNEDTQSSDWLHFNSLSYLGPNRWYDAGDERFHPDNVIFSSREANIVAIVARSGNIVWRMGPDYRATPETQAIGQVIGQHHPHLIPEGLPGAGNLMVFDNGGGAGYGAPNPISPDGRHVVERYSSRILEINPVTMEKVWEYSFPGHGSFRFFSFNVSMAQRLPNGNTLITEGATGRVFEVTVDHEIVWEYINPYFYENDDMRQNIYRAYRIPYDWIPQLDPPEERAVPRIHPSDFRIEPQ